jgi:sec-independent protein translocase protein TatA
MPNLGFMEIMILLVVVLLVFGAKRLPEIGASMGKGIREFKKSITDTQDAVMRDDSASRSMLDGGKSTTDAANTTANSGEPRRLSQ